MSQVNNNSTTSTDVVLVSFLLNFEQIPRLMLEFEHVFADLVCMVCETQNLLTLQLQFIRKYLLAETRIIQRLVICNALQIN